MKKKLLFPKVFTLLALGAMSSASAQSFPEFTNATPNGSSIKIFRTAPLVGDYDNDGQHEVLAVGRQSGPWAVVSYELGYEDGALSSTAGWHEKLGLPDNHIYNPTITWIDYDNDGALELLLMGTTTDNNESDKATNLLLNLYEQDGTGFKLVEGTGLEGLYIEQENQYGHALVVADCDNDGYQDILLTGKVNGNSKVWLYKNKEGNGAFEKVEGLFTNLNNGTISVGDFNNDGLPDVLYNGWDQNGKVKLYKNTGNGTFVDMNIEAVVTEGTQKGRIMWADINSDGYLDFIVTGERKNDGDNTWSKHADLYINDTHEGFCKAEFQEGKSLAGISYGSIDVADLNSDGLPDVVCVGDDGQKSSALYLNRGADETGKYAFEKQANAFGQLRSGADVVIADYDNDGYLDVFSMGYGSEIAGGTNNPAFFAWHNDGNLTKNEAPAAPTDLQASYADGAWTFTWQGGSDKETPEAALTYNVYVKKKNGELITVIPADIATGFLKTTELTPALRTCSYTLPLPNETMEWGVQTIDQGKTGSTFAVSTTTQTTTSTPLHPTDEVNVYVQEGTIYATTSNLALVTLYTASGTCVAHNQQVQGTQVIQNGLKPGIYLVKINTAQGEKVEKVVL